MENILVAAGLLVALNHTASISQAAVLDKRHAPGLCIEQRLEYRRIF
jgi:hypothetical protein